MGGWQLQFLFFGERERKIFFNRVCCVLAPICLLLTAIKVEAQVLKPAPSPTPDPKPVESWRMVVRESPFWISQGVYENLATVRRWVLLRNSFCEVAGRHILFDARARFLGYLDDAKDVESTQALINQRRKQLQISGQVDAWSPGAEGVIGYPFALSCNQPEADLRTALARYVGKVDAARLWGTWDGMRIGTPARTVSLHEAIAQVYDNRVAAGRVTMPNHVLSTLAGKILIESGGRPDAHSAAGARGILQLSEAALSDCGFAERFHFHRMAQIDCALQLLEKNHQNLETPFRQAFGHLPASKRSALYSMLLIQAYHGGVWRVIKLFSDPEQQKAAQYFARHHERFSAGDIALGMVFHNLGRDRWGFASLYYVTDVGIAVQHVCSAVAAMPGCSDIAVGAE